MPKKIAAFGRFDADSKLALGMIGSPEFDLGFDRLSVLLEITSLFRGYGFQMKGVCLIGPVDTNEDVF